jgi:DNA-binding transcriptional LysR family regulator
MDKLSAMRTFCKVVELGSFSRAAHHLDVSTTVVTRHVADLESALGSRLLNRTTRSLSLTERGELYLQRSLQILEAIEEAEMLITASGKALSGSLRISAPVNVGVHILPALLHRFQLAHPDISFDVLLTDDPIDMVTRGLDISITLAENLLNAEAVARSFISAKMILCATPEYLSKHPAPATPDDLAGHHCIVHSAQSQTSHAWNLQGKDGSIRKISIKPTVKYNTALLAQQCVLAHMGIAMLPYYFAQAEIKSGRIVHLLDSYELLDKELVLAYPSRKYLNVKTRTFIDFLLTELKPQRVATKPSVTLIPAIRMSTPVAQPYPRADHEHSRPDPRRQSAGIRSPVLVR